jgi:hypothetical protein
MRRVSSCVVGISLSGINDTKKVDHLISLLRYCHCASSFTKSNVSMSTHAGGVGKSNYKNPKSIWTKTPLNSAQWRFSILYNWSHHLKKKIKKINNNRDKKCSKFWNCLNNIPSESHVSLANCKLLLTIKWYIQY